MQIKGFLEKVKDEAESPAISRKRQKFLDFCCTCVKVILAVVLCILTILSMLVTCSVDMDEVIHYAPDKIYYHILFAAAIFLLLIVCRHVRNSLRGSWLERGFRDLTKNIDFCKVMVACHFIIGIFWVVSTQVKPQADQMLCAEIAERQMFSDYDFGDYMQGGYMYNYPYQSGLVLMISIVFRLFGGMNYVAFQICNVLALLLFDIALLKITEYMESPAAKKVGAVLIFLFWPLLFYTVFVYGNLMGLAFSVAAICFEYRYFRKRRLRDIVISSVFIGLAVMMKSNYLIFLVAMLIFLVLDFISSMRKRTILFAVLAIACYLIGMKGPITYMTIRGDLDIDAFLYNQGQPGVNANCYVENWEFCLSNRQNSGQNPNHGQNGNYQPNGNNQNGNYPSGGGQNNHNPNGNKSSGSYIGMNGPNGNSANSRNINGGYSGNVPGGVPAQANGYGNPNQNAGGGYGYNPNPGDSYYSERFDGVPQEPLPYN